MLASEEEVEGKEKAKGQNDEGGRNDKWGHYQRGAGVQVAIGAPSLPLTSSGGFVE